MPLELITLENTERFAEFVYKLNQKMPDLEKSCRHTTQFAFDVLDSMGNVDILGTLEYLSNRGGYCDCETMMNAVPWNSEGGLDLSELQEKS